MLGNALPLEAGSIYNLVGHPENGATQEDMEMGGAGKAAQLTRVTCVRNSIPTRVYIQFIGRRRTFDPYIVGL